MPPLIYEMLVFIRLDLWPPDSCGFNPVDYTWCGESCRRVYARCVCVTLTSWSSIWSVSGLPCNNTQS